MERDSRADARLKKKLLKVYDNHMIYYLLGFHADKNVYYCIGQSM